MPLALRGHLIDTPAWGEIRHIPEGALIIGDDGKIAATGPAADIETDPRWANLDLDWLPFPDSAAPLICPGLIDIHAHLPQYPAVARPLGGATELLPWLNRHIFPLERDFRTGRGATRELLDAFFAEIASNGTTTAVLYAAIWADSCDLAFQAAAGAGLRIVMGKVMMDEGTYGDLAPEPTRELSLDETKRLIRTWHGKNRGLIEYAVSPRFAVTCSAELMRGAARLAAEHDTYIQTHLSENHAEIETVAKRFPQAVDYTDVYDQCGLLSSKTILGHCLHLSPREIETLAARDARVAHCPTSNLFLNSGLCPLDRLRRAGLPIALGSDIAGGPELNLWQVMRAAIDTQKARRLAAIEQHQNPNATGLPPLLTPAHAFYLATRGGADVLGKSRLIGSLDPGLEADLAVFDLNQALPCHARFQSASNLSPEELLALLIYRTTPHAHLATLVRGQKISAL